MKKDLEIVVATRNQGKITELMELLETFPVNLRSLSEFENIFEVEETGETFADNAILKARSYALQTNCWALADDSGLEVEALNNAPGIFSARYGGENSTQAEKNTRLLDELNATNNSNRQARFVCTMAIANEQGEIVNLAKGFCVGKLSLAPKGTNGFGYDPIFIPAGFSQTFGEIPENIKNEISHRAAAIREVMGFFSDFLS